MECRTAGGNLSKDKKKLRQIISQLILNPPKKSKRIGKRERYTMSGGCKEAEGEIVGVL